MQANPKILFLIFYILKLTSQDGGSTIIKKAKDLTLVCNRNLIHSLMTTDNQFEKEKNHQPTEKIHSECPNIQVTCCSEKEIIDLNKEINNKMSQLDTIKSQIEKIFELLQDMDVEKYKALVEHITECGKNARNPDAVKSVFEKNEEDLIKIVDHYFLESERNFKGIVCTICDARKNKFLLPVQRENRDKPELRITVKSQSCLNHFDVLNSYLEFVEFVYNLMDISSFFLCAQDQPHSFFNEYNYSEFEKKKHLYERCSILNNKDLVNDQECKNTCILLHNFVLWDDLLDTFVILERVEMSLRITFQEDVDQNDLIHKNHDLKFIFNTPKESEYDLKENYLVSIEQDDGIAPFKETTPYYDFLFLGFFIKMCLFLPFFIIFL